MIIPRVYTNKPRTTGDGYKGMLHQPEPDKAPDLLAGIIAIRKMHIRVLQETGLSSADEMLYPENRSYLDDVLSYEAIGARSVENQQHRLTASGMDIPVGMKNPTSGDLSVMLNSVIAAQHPHHFIYRGCDVETSGNPLAHTILAAALINMARQSLIIITKISCVFMTYTAKKICKIRPLSWMSTILTPANNTKNRFVL